CATRFTVGAAFCATAMPARVEPVNDTIAMSGCEARAAPTVGPSPLTRLKTPGGTPASCSISAKIIASKGASSLGFNTIVQPAAGAGAPLTATWVIGQFHGGISADGPSGSFTTSVEPTVSSNG